MRLGCDAVPAVRGPSCARPARLGACDSPAGRSQAGQVPPQIFDFKGFRQATRLFSFQCPFETFEFAVV